MKEISLAFLFVLGVALMCNEGYWWPWINLIGILIVALTVYLFNKKICE